MGTFHPYFAPKRCAEICRDFDPVPPLRGINLTPYQRTLVVLSERKNGLVMMIGDGINDAVDFKIPSEIMNHFGRKGGPQGVEHGQNVNDFLGDGPAHRT
jgi:hypothetical protein